ncbi:hypothetical protein KKF34_17535 [Myxococcota bacterium]|nr:hypothetical protein [Myxococcota bacterium]MBU1380165.1 hypothetical protein [Myxococcota bacterium]MBU1498685.1 hypothetical protein [Myxococcota bacterium]
MISLSSKLHPGAVLNARKKRFLKIIAFGTASGAILSLIIGFAAAQIIKSRSINPILDFSFIFPVSVLAISIAFLFILRYLLNTTVLTLTEEKITYRRLLSAGISISISDIDGGFVKYVPGGSALLLRSKNQQVQIDLNRINSNEILEFLVNLDPVKFNFINELLLQWISPKNISSAKNEELLRFYLQYGFDEKASEILSTSGKISSDDLGKLYFLDRVNQDFLLMRELIPSYLKYLKNRLPQEDLVRISIILHQNSSEMFSDCMNYPPETITNETLEKWKETIKFRKYPELPYGSIGSKIMQGTGNYLYLNKEKTLSWRDGIIDPVWIVGYCANYGVLGISDIEIYDISGRRFSINRDTFETLIMLRTHLPWAMELTKGSYIAARTRFRRKRILSAIIPDSITAMN